MRRMLVLLAAIGFAPLACGASITTNGVLGNSGAQGASLVRFAPQAAAGMGVALDRFGSLWDRGGRGTLNRYAPDGRLLASYRIPGHNGRSDQLTLVGDRLVLQLDNQLYLLPIDAPAGSEARKMDRESRALSLSARNGSLATWRNKTIELFDPASGAVSVVATCDEPGQLEIGADGAVYAARGDKLHRYPVGSTPAGAESASAGAWPRPSPGDRMQVIDGFWYGHAWHGTIRRFDAGLEPAPGVVLGGASGSFIGHLDQNTELFNGRGLARLDGGLFAVSGNAGVMHLLAWDPVLLQMTIIRRIGALPACRGLGLDREGRVWCQLGTWTWDDQPDAPLQRGVNPPEEIGQAAMLDSDAVVAPAFMWGKPRVYAGGLGKEVSIHEADGLRRGLVGSAAYRTGDRTSLLVIDAAGKAQEIDLERDGRPIGAARDVALASAAPAPRAWTSLAMKDAKTLVAAADGQVLEFARDGAGWKESRRWRTWGAGPDQGFSPAIHVAADAGRLWVADGGNHRVLCFAADGALLAAFGKAGTGANELDSPAMLTVRGDKAVVHDLGNQRLVRLEFTR